MASRGREAGRLRGEGESRGRGVIDRTLIFSPTRTFPRAIERVQEPVNVSAPLSVQVGQIREERSAKSNNAARSEREIESGDCRGRAVRPGEGTMAGRADSQ